MSSTKRGAKRSEADFYITPSHACRRLFEDPWIQAIPGGRWLEPCAGDGQIIKVANTIRTDIHWASAELRPQELVNLVPISPAGVQIGDLLTLSNDAFGPDKFELAVTNPPFSIAWEVLHKCRQLAKRTILLLRLNFWESAKRREFFETNPPDCLVLPDRPAFTLNKKGKPSTDSISYAWFCWDLDRELQNIPFGRTRVLPMSTKAERSEWATKLRQEAEREAA